MSEREHSNTGNKDNDAKSKRKGAAVDTPNDDNPSSAGNAPLPKEIGGREGPDPTRYGDWEKAGRCIDF